MTDKPEVGDYISVLGEVFPDGRPREGHVEVMWGPDLGFIRMIDLAGIPWIVMTPNAKVVEKKS